MATIPEALTIAIQHHQAGRIQVAERIYRQILAVAPNQADAWHLLGLLSSQACKYDAAIEYIGRAISLHGTEAVFHGNLAIAFTQAGRPDEAVTCCYRALELKPDYAEAHNVLGIAFMTQGKLDEAVASYGRALELRPGYAEANYNLGIAFMAQGQLDEAVASYRRALELKPDYAEAYNNLGDVFREQGKLDRAVACYHRAVELTPDYVQAHNNLGIALKGQGKWEEAVACYRRVLERKPDCAEAHSNLGNALNEQGKFSEAIACHRRALELKPHFVEAHNNLGVALMNQGKLDEAIACYRRALEWKPDFAEAHSNLGNVFTHQGKLSEAAACCRRALELRPDYAEAHNNLGILRRNERELPKAVACFRHALELKPDYAEAHNNLGNALKDAGKLTEAVACYRRAQELKQDYAEAEYNLGNAYKDQGKLDEAVGCFRRALELKPDDLAAAEALVHGLQHLCQWEDVEKLSQRLIAAVDGDSERTIAAPVAPFGLFALPTTSMQQLRCARKWVERHLVATGAPEHILALNRQPDRRSKLTVGYLSADYRPHPVAYLIAELFEKHDRRRFSVFGYSIGPDDGSPMRRRLADSFDRFVDLQSDSFMDAAQRICSDGVDILVDLTGYTKNSRTRILALRPAPIQVSYLGYTGTMGAAFMDYIIVDRFVVPPEQQPFFAEKLVHLPGCYQINDSQREISPRTPSRAECGLPEAGFVFCCFNNSFKITPQMFDVWMRLLKAVPGSVLWLPEGNGLAPPNLRREAMARGVAAERLVFAPSLPHPEHLARYRAADLFLDTFPFNAHATASDALWAGCPVLTLAGETFVSRVAGSLLRALELPELVTTSLDDYEAMASRLVRDRELLCGLRTRLETNRRTSPLFDSGRFVRDLERAFATMWQICVSGETPRAFAVSAG